MSPKLIIPPGACMPAIIKAGKEMEGFWVFLNPVKLHLLL